jgi:membrane fusion protein, multidrug efflux system
MRIPMIRLAIVAAGTVAVITLAVVGIDFGAPHKSAAATASESGGQPALPVPVVRVVRKAVPVYLEYVASAEAIRSVTLEAKVTGYLSARGAEDGANVEKGALLYRIDPRDYQAALDQAEAQAQRDAAQREYAEANERRNQSLSKNGDVSLDSYQQSASALHQVDAALGADRAVIETAQLNLGYTEIHAPFAGRLSKSLVHEGALISAAGTQLNTLVQLDPIYVSFNPPETDLAAITEAQTRGPVAADVMFGDDPTPRFSGTLSFLDNTVDRTTGTITARVTIANPAQTLLPGEFTRVRLKVGENTDALLVPQTAVGSSQLGRFVYVVGQNDTAEQRVVTLGRNVGDLVVVEKGVVEGNSVIVGNLQKLGPGAPVKPTPPQGAAGS